MNRESKGPQTLPINQTETNEDSFAIRSAKYHGWHEKTLEQFADHLRESVGDNLVMELCPDPDDKIKDPSNAANIKVFNNGAYVVARINEDQKARFEDKKKDYFYISYYLYLGNRVLIYHVQSTKSLPVRKDEN